MTTLSVWKVFCATFLLCAATAIAAPAQTFNSLVSFDGTDGANPYFMSLVQGIDGQLYGTTYRGGALNDGSFFKVTPNGKLTTLYNFGTNAAYPVPGLVLSTDGSFYGTTSEGGTNGYGTVFKITPQGTLTVMHSFNVSDGSFPYGPLIQATDGNFYGTTTYGGNALSCPFYPQGCGTVFKITPGGTLTTLYSFVEETDGLPMSGLAQGRDRALYGTASGGTCCAGTVFKITTDGQYTQLHYFCSQPKCSDGDTPVGGLLLANDGNFYGTTEYGGSNSNNLPWGTVFRITPSGTLTTIYNFCSSPGCADGGAPFAGLVQATDGNFYGTAIVNGINEENGLLFAVTGSGIETPLYSFCSRSGCPDGAVTYGGLVQATNGIFYGATYEGGNPYYGTVYSLDMGLGPFVAFVRNSGKVGQTGGILGQGFNGTTSVSLDGVQATFTVVSDTFIRATVPPGATTGFVTVTTPSGTLTSNVPFRVLP